MEELETRLEWASRPLPSFQIVASVLSQTRSRPQKRELALVVALDVDVRDSTPEVRWFGLVHELRELL